MSKLRYVLRNKDFEKIHHKLPCNLIRKITNKYKKVDFRLEK